MAFIRRWWKKILYFLVTGSTSVFIAACYGMPVGFGSLGTWTIRTEDGENQPIEGLEVTVLQFVGNSPTADTLDRRETDSTGTALFNLTTYDQDASHIHQALIRDIDGDANGGTFNDTLVTKEESDQSTIEMHGNQ